MDLDHPVAGEIQTTAEPTSSTSNGVQSNRFSTTLPEPLVKEAASVVTEVSLESCSPFDTTAEELKLLRFLEDSELYNREKNRKKMGKGHKAQTNKEHEFNVAQTMQNVDDLIMDIINSSSK